MFLKHDSGAASTIWAILTYLEIGILVHGLPDHTEGIPPADLAIDIGIGKLQAGPCFTIRTAISIAFLN